MSVYVSVCECGREKYDCVITESSLNTHYVLMTQPIVFIVPQPTSILIINLSVPTLFEHPYPLANLPRNIIILYS